LPEADISASNLVLSDEQCRAVVAAAYENRHGVRHLHRGGMPSAARGHHRLPCLDVDDLHCWRQTTADGAVELEGERPHGPDKKADTDFAQSWRNG